MNLAEGKEYIHDQSKGHVYCRFFPGVLFLGRDEGDIDIREGIEFASTVPSGRYDCQARVPRPFCLLVRPAARNPVNLLDDAVHQIRVPLEKIAAGRGPRFRAEEFGAALPELPPQAANLILHACFYEHAWGSGSALRHSQAA